MTVRAVVFDLYGTLIDEAPRATWRAMQDELAAAVGIERETFAQLWVDTYTQRATGPFTPSLRAICEQAGIEPGEKQLEQVMAIRHRRLRDHLVPRADAEETLAELRGRGLKLGLVTECSDVVPELWPQSPFARYFDAQVYTCAVGARKPAQILYDLVCERLGVEHADCVYVGDGGGYELAGAAAVGMRPILIVAPHVEWLHPEAEEWAGARVSRLSELLALI